jgi:hypothetical protein
MVGNSRRSGFQRPLQARRFRTFQAFPKDLGALSGHTQFVKCGDPPAAVRANGERS